MLVKLIFSLLNLFFNEMNRGAACENKSEGKKSPHAFSVR
jgi:hypothetical protein